MKFFRSLFVVLTICFACFVLGCNSSSPSSGTSTEVSSSKINADNFLRIKPGMSHMEVKLILGDPTEDDYVSELRLRTMKWREGSKQITVLLQNGVVMQHQGTAAKTHKGL